MSSNVSELLSSVYFRIHSLNEAKERFAEQLAPNFNIFNYLRKDEIGLSLVIAELINPNGNHGQGDVFLKLFLEILECTSLQATNKNQWKITTEKQTTESRRIDIYINSPSMLIGIENKPWAVDQEKQLNDYAKYIKRQASNENKKWLLIYISNREPSVESIDDIEKNNLLKSGNLKLIKFYSIVTWLEKCATVTKALPVRIFIEEFAKFIRININGENDMA